MEYLKEENTSKHNEAKYKPGDYVEYMTHQPDVHVQDMFGYGQVPLDEIGERMYKGRVKSVIANGEAYLIMSLQPLGGYYCVENCDKITRRLPDSEVTEKMKNNQDDPDFLAPNVFVNEEPMGASISENCEKIARKAMASLFPNDNVAEVTFVRSWFLKEDIVSDLDDMMASLGKVDEKLQEQKNEMTEMIMQKRFKEYYRVEVGVQDDKDEDLKQLKAWLEERGVQFNPEYEMTKYYIVAVDTNFKEVSIMRNSKERSCFIRSLGPEYDHVRRIKLVFSNSVNERKDKN